MRGIATAVVALCMLLASQAHAGDWFKGTYTVEIDGRVVGTEEFKFRASESGAFYASSKVEGKHVEVTTNLELNADGTFRKYKDFVLQGTRRRGAIGFPFKGGIRLVRDKDTKGKDIHDLSPGSSFVALHSRVFHLYGDLARKHMGGPPVATYSVLWVDRHAVGTVQVQALGPASLMKNDRSIPLTALEVRGEGLNAVLLVDKEGRPHRVDDGRHVATLRGYKLAYGEAPDSAAPEGAKEAAAEEKPPAPAGDPEEADDAGSPSEPTPDPAPAPSEE